MEMITISRITWHSELCEPGSFSVTCEVLPPEKGKRFFFVVVLEETSYYVRLQVLVELAMIASKVSIDRLVNLHRCCQRLADGRSARQAAAVDRSML